MKVICANWKMYKIKKDVEDFFNKWRNFGRIDCEIVFFPQYPLIEYVKKYCTYEKVGAQNCNENLEGAFTGEVSAKLLKDIGCDYVLVGHSERRHLYGEKNEMMSKKIKNAIDCGIRVLYCVGERLEEREEGKTLDVVYEQLSILKDVQNEGYDIAYEPVWAIGTGKVAKPEDASFVQGKIKEYLDKNNLGKNLRILYGGSVKPENAKELLSAENVDGLLVGGASLDPVSFYNIALQSL